MNTSQCTRPECAMRPRRTRSCKIALPPQRSNLTGFYHGQPQNSELDVDVDVHGHIILVYDVGLSSAGRSSNVHHPTRDIRWLDLSDACPRQSIMTIHVISTASWECLRGGCDGSNQYAHASELERITLGVPVRHCVMTSAQPGRISK